jgi:hypothetical protein
MKALTRRKLEMGERALEFSRTHPDASPGYAAALARLEERLVRGEQLAAQQREGILRVRTATAAKRDLRRAVKRSHIRHLARVADVAAKEAPDLAPEKFRLPRASNPYLAFRTAVRGMAAEAEARKELLVKHGLSETVLGALTKALDEFDAAAEQGAQGRLAHVGASADLDAVADEVVQIVHVMDGLNRYRFEKQPELLAAWESASNVVATPRPDVKPAPAPTPEGTPPAGGEVRPAA